ncbi:putative tyrosine transporter P-protein [Paraburkholderia caribensis MBA4]|uniref:Putative tyrosine transporter P-protein n=1 Tax=Paraburkholderia caribensis MBA4 TaxID=1323664 RepID=A0A0P0RKC5_9BURK|nr:SLC13 family permease [Paraburkholderia caribensis]ALL69295.1 putative tyrosine transporter P-protein [Paraburkholderia caribensis MBA4]
MSQLQIYITVSVFAAVILLIAFDVIDMAVTALMGACILIALGILDEQDLLAATRTAAGPLGLLFGGMVVARILATTGLFDRIGDAYLRATGGSGTRFLLMLIALVAPICAVLPNATTVILLAPIIIRVCMSLETDFVRPMVLTAIISNSAGLLTLVGDPATFLVGSAIGLTFGEYLRRVSLGGLIAVLVIVPLLPVLMRDLWNLRRTLPPRVATKRLERPLYAAFAGAVLLAMVALFVIGEELPTRIVPPAVAVIAGALALLVSFAARVEPTDNVLRDVDWKTLIFLASIFCLVQAMAKTGLLQLLALKLYQVFGSQLTLVALLLLAGIGLLSSLLANVPVAAASIVMVKGYLVMAEVVPETALSAGFTQWPVVSIPVFVGMMFGATLGGNATLVGAAANIVAAGICARQGKPVTFGTFLRYGLPITVVQLAVSALYVVAMARLLR